jgi:E3 ubiquitin-protein ligase synoviolin
MALARYVVGSFVVAGGLVYHAMSTREQYFPAMLYLSSSKLSVVVLGNLAFALTLCLGHLLKAIFLGRLGRRRSSACTSARRTRSWRRASR